MGREGHIIPQKNDYNFEHIEKESSKLLDFSDTLDLLEEEKRESNCILDCLSILTYDSSLQKWRPKFLEISIKNIENSSIDTNKIKIDSLSGKKFKDSSLSSKKIRNGSITNSKISNGAVDSDHISNASLLNKHFNSNASIKRKKFSKGPPNKILMNSTPEGRFDSIEKLPIKKGGLESVNSKESRNNLNLVIGLDIHEQNEILTLFSDISINVSNNFFTYKGGYFDIISPMELRKNIKMGDEESIQIDPNISFGIPSAGKERLVVDGNLKLNGALILNGYNLSSLKDPEAEDSPVPKKWFQDKIKILKTVKQKKSLYFIHRDNSTSFKGYTTCLDPKFDNLQIACRKKCDSCFFTGLAHTGDKLKETGYVSCGYPKCPTKYKGKCSPVGSGYGHHRIGTCENILGVNKGKVLKDHLLPMNGEDLKMTFPFGLSRKSQIKYGNYKNSIHLYKMQGLYHFHFFGTASNRAINNSNEKFKISLATSRDGKIWSTQSTSRTESGGMLSLEATILVESDDLYIGVFNNSSGERYFHDLNYNLYHKGPFVGRTITLPLEINQESKDNEDDEKVNKVSCTDPIYTKDESKNISGPNTCSNNCDCDGQRTCSPWNWCEGDARSPKPEPKPIPPKPDPKDCKSPSYNHNESLNKKGPNQCDNACDCDGQRTCSPSKWCEGNARPPKVKPTPAPKDCKSPNYNHNESLNKKGPNQCSNNCDCDGQRTCSPWNWCEGDARPSKPKPKPKPKPKVSCTSKRYYHNEAKNRQGSNRCRNHCECDGARKCSIHGWCTGRSR